MNVLRCLYLAVAIAAVLLLSVALLTRDTFTIFAAVLLLLIAASEVWEHSNG